jgi:hypothetical protein
MVKKQQDKVGEELIMKLNDLDENWQRKDAYQRDYDSSVSGFGNRREIDDEANLMYIYKDGHLRQKMINNHDERQAHSMGFRDSKEAALKLHGIVRSKYHQGKWIKNEGGKWVEVYPFGKPDNVTEDATAGATSSANVAVGAVYKNKPPKQPKNKDGTAKNALDIKANLLTGGSIKR